MTLTSANTVSRLALDIGAEILLCGGEVSRAEESAKRIALMLGMKECEVFAVPSFMLLTCESPEGETLAMSRSLGAISTDLTRLEGLNALSREICAGRLTEEQASSRLSVLNKKEEPPPYLLYMASMAVCAVFTLFFGGGCAEASVAALAANVTVLMKRMAKNRFGNAVIFTFVCSLLCGSLGAAMVALGLASSYSPIAMGDIMLLIPGITLICAGRDIIVGDLITGILELTETALTAAALTLGFALPELWLSF